MQKKFKGSIDQNLKEKLKLRLSKSQYWQERFDSFNLNLDHVLKENFPKFTKAGGIPKGYEGNKERFEFPKNKII